MNSLRSFERLLYKTESNEGFKYPELGDEEFVYMDTESSGDRSVIRCFPYYMRTEERNYIDIYIWDVMLPEGYKRFVLEYGYSLPEEDEDVFLGYLYGDIKIDSSLCKQLVRMIKREYPDVHLDNYKDERHILLHLYYTFHRTGPYEILFKSNLNHLAVGLRRMEEYNLIGSSPEKIFDIQLGMLRALNSDIGCGILESVENRRLANRFYSTYHNLIRGTRINKYQWIYMKERDDCGEKVDKQMFRFLGILSSDRQYYTYLKYIERKEIVDEYYAILPKYPEEEDLEAHFGVCDMIEWYIEHEWYIDGCLKDKERKYKHSYSYETDEYIVLVPSSLEELLAEAQNQHNCLYKYVLRMACENTVILFMREKSKEKASLITIEVEDGVIRQALKAYNRMPDEKQRGFLEEYAALKNLVFRKEDDFYWADDDEEDDDEYWDEE